MPKIGDYEFYDFEAGEKVKFEVRVQTDAKGNCTGFIKKISDERLNYMYNFYDEKGVLIKQDLHVPNNPKMVTRYYENRPNMGSLEFVLELLRDNEAFQIRCDNLLSVVVAQADKLRELNNEKILDDLTVKVQELAKSIPPKPSAPEPAMDSSMDNLFGMEPF